MTNKLEEELAKREHLWRALINYRSVGSPMQLVEHVMDYGVDHIPTPRDTENLEKAVALINEARTLLEPYMGDIYSKDTHAAIEEAKVSAQEIRTVMSIFK
jgi:hypothetical protein